MRNQKMIIAATFASLFTAFSSAHATTSHLVDSGTAVELSLGSSLATTQPDCTVDVSVSFTAASSVQRVGGTSGTGAGLQAFLVVTDLCMGTVEFGSIDASLASGALSVASRSATLKASFVVTMTVFDPAFNQIGTRNRTLAMSSLVFDAVGTESSVSKTHVHFRYPTFSSVSNGQTVEKPANVSGSVALDGQLLLPNPTSAYTASFDTSHSVSVTINK